MGASTLPQAKTIALESTGIYWIPLFELLESLGFEVYLVEPGQLSRCGARPKTDVLDAQWIQRLHYYGLLRASFRPPDSVLALRAYWRQRQMLVRYAATHAQHMQKAMEQMNLKLTQAVSDITGVTGMLTSRVTIALRMAAQAVGQTMTPLGLFYRRIRSRLGGLGAIKATAHKLACLVYRMLKYGQEYVTQSMEEYEAKAKVNMLKALKRKTAAMGFVLSPLPT